MCKFSKELKSMAAKTDREGKDGSKWLPFRLHSMDTAAVMDYLTENRYRSAAQICGLKQDEFKRVCHLAALLHDIGKVTASFQSMISLNGSEKNEYMEISDISRFTNAMHHSKMGEAILLYEELDYEFPVEFASIIGAHHGNPADCEPDVEEYPYNFYDRQKLEYKWRAVWKEWIDYSLKDSGYEDAEDIPKLSQKAQVIICGLLIMADWLASDTDKFSLIDRDTDNIDIESRIEYGLDKIEFPDEWNSEIYNINDNEFEEQFGFKPNSVQRETIKVIKNSKNPGLIILETPMGSGKTEAALAAAQLLANKKDKHGIFFGLPTQATANGVFGRVVSWAEKQSEEFSHSINLAHTNAEFQPVFEQLPKHIPNVDDDTDSGLIVHQFFAGRKQSCLADFVVGTVDRMLMAALKRKHVMLLHLGLSQKVAIVDECHAYDAYMNRYLERALHWLRKYDVPVILLSATLPPERRKALACAYLDKEPDEVKLDEDTAYPLITWTDSDEVYSKHIEYDKDKKTVYIERAVDADVLDIVKETKERGGCVGIICNSVKRAQYFAKAISDAGIDKVILYHAQYIMPDRAKKESTISETVGKNSEKEQRKGAVVVGTQVLEQSLDIDFDVLITDLCPMDLLLQRMGRMYRHDRKFRPYDKPRTIVLNADKNNLEEASEYIYGKWLLFNTVNFLPDSVNMPEDIAALVKSVYECAQTENECEEKAYSDYKLKVEKKESKAGAYLLGKYKKSKIMKVSLHHWLENGVNDKESNAKAAVRDGAEGVEVIVLKENSDGTLSLLPHLSNGEKFSQCQCPENEQCKAIAKQKLRLPSALSAQWNIDKVIDSIEKMDENLKSWQQSHWLKGELILILNDELKAEVGGNILSYSEDVGLTYERAEELE